jgi:hypothetical protein
MNISLLNRSEPAIPLHQQTARNELYLRWKIDREQSGTVHFTKKKCNMKKLNNTIIHFTIRLREMRKQLTDKLLKPLTMLAIITDDGVGRH